MSAQQQAEEGLRRARENLSVTAQLLHAVADALSNHEPTDPVSIRSLGRAFTQAGAELLAQYPRAVREVALDRALDALPHAPAVRSTLTDGEYALQLRLAARAA
jgi:hypothetical protein